MIEKVGEVLVGFVLKKFEKDATAKELLLKIQNCIKVGELEKARDCCIELMGLRHDNPDVYSLLATVQYELKEYDKCLKSLQEAIRLQPSIHSYWELKGDALKALDRHHEAIDAYNQAIKLHPASQSAKQKRDACQAMLPSPTFNEAIDAYNQAIKLNPSSSQPSLLSRIGRLGNQDFGSFSTSSITAAASIFSSISSSSASNIELRSAKGIDYRELEQLLKAKEWRKADDLTYRLMLKAQGREKEKLIDLDSINKFPCEDLQTINRLWVHYSNGLYGFSVQKEIYIECGFGDPLWELISFKIWEKFCDRTAWKKDGEFVSYYTKSFFENNFMNAKGHLPRQAILLACTQGGGGETGNGIKWLSFVSSRLVECKA